MGYAGVAFSRTRCGELELLLGEVAERANRSFHGVVPRQTTIHPKTVAVTFLHRKEGAGRRVDVVLQRLLPGCETTVLKVTLSAPSGLSMASLISLAL